MRQKVFKQEFRPDQDSQILNKYVENETRSDRSKEITPKIEQVLFKTLK